MDKFIDMNDESMTALPARDHICTASNVGGFRSSEAVNRTDNAIHADMKSFKLHQTRMEASNHREVKQRQIMRACQRLPMSMIKALSLHPLINSLSDRKWHPVFSKTKTGQPE
jgi:hypothetical protein